MISPFSAAYVSLQTILLISGHFSNLWLFLYHLSLTQSPRNQPKFQALKLLKTVVDKNPSIPDQCNIPILHFESSNVIALGFI